MILILNENLQVVFFFGFVDQILSSFESYYICFNFCLVFVCMLWASASCPVLHDYKQPNIYIYLAWPVLINFSLRYLCIKYYLELYALILIIVAIIYA